MMTTTGVADFRKFLSRSLAFCHKRLFGGLVLAHTHAEEKSENRTNSEEKPNSNIGRTIPDWKHPGWRIGFPEEVFRLLVENNRSLSMGLERILIISKLDFFSRTVQIGFVGEKISVPSSSPIAINIQDEERWNSSSSGNKSSRIWLIGKKEELKFQPYSLHN